LLCGAAALRALRRFHRRFAFDYTPANRSVGEPWAVDHPYGDALNPLSSPLQQMLQYCPDHIHAQHPEQGTGQYRERQNPAPR
jgi:hypothetical protein